MGFAHKTQYLRDCLPNSASTPRERGCLALRSHISAQPIPAAISATTREGIGVPRKHKQTLVNMQTSVRAAAVIAVALSLACLVKAQPASAPAPAPAVYSTYTRPNNSDCVASTATSLDYFPLQFQIGGSSGTTTQQQINVCRACWPQDAFAEIFRYRACSLSIECL